MKKISLSIILALLFFDSCTKNAETVSPLSPMESSKWILTKLTSNTDPPENLTECSKDIWEFKNGLIKNTVVAKTGCFYSDNYNGKKYMIKGKTIILTSNSFDDPDSEATISYSGNTMTWQTVLDLSAYGGPRYIYNLIFTKQ